MTATPAPPPTAKPGLSLILLLAALAGMGPAAIDIYLPSLPAIAHDFGAPAGRAELTVAAFLLGLSSGQLFHGPLADRIGRRPPLIAATALFVAASVGSVFAPTIEILIGFRFLQAVGACAGAVISRAIVRDLYDDRQTVQVLSILMGVTGVAPVAAPLIGSMLLKVGGWRTTFWLLAAFGLVLLAWVSVGLKESRTEATAQLAKTESVARAYRAVIGDRTIIGYSITCGFAMAAMFAYIASSANVMIGHYGLSPQGYAVVFAVNAAGIIGVSQLNRILGRRYAPHTLLVWSTGAAIVAGLLVAGAAWSGWGGLAGLLVPLFFVVSNVGFAMPNTIAGAMAVDPQRAGAISAVIGAAPFGCGAAAAAVTGLFNDGTARPMGTTIALCLVISRLGLALVPPPARTEAVGSPKR